MGKREIVYSVNRSLCLVWAGIIIFLILSGTMKWYYIISAIALVVCADKRQEGIEAIVITVMGIVAIVLASLGVFPTANKSGDIPISDLYPKTAVVIELDRERDTVVCEDSTGNLWEFSGIEDWIAGDTVSLLMDSRGTSTIHDDAVVSAQYSAFQVTEREVP